MKVWCGVNEDGWRSVWPNRPIWHDKQWRPNGELALLQNYDRKLLDMIFPRNIKPGECKQVTIKRWVVNDRR